MPINFSRYVAAITSTALIATPVLAQSADSLQDLVGSKGAGGETQLEARGFVNVGSHTDENTIHTFWWNADKKDCIHVQTFEGRYNSIVDAPNTDCGHENKGKDNTAVAVAAVAGVALIAALLASKKSHKDKNYSRQQEADFDRGFRDGWNKAGYHNYGNSSAYYDGYNSGVDQRKGNSHHSSSHGYFSMAQYSDLNGDRASSADSALRKRGFKNVDSFKSGYTAYTIWNRRSSHQCLQMTVADGRVQDIRDIQTHPKCR